MNLPLDINTILHLGNFSSRTVSAKIIFRKGSLRKQPGTGGPTVTLGVSKEDCSLNRNRTRAKIIGNRTIFAITNVLQNPDYKLDHTCTKW